jgi:hypothetical protein
MLPLETMASNLLTAPTREQIYLELHNVVDDNTENLAKIEPKKSKNSQFDIEVNTTYEKQNLFREGLNKITNKDDIQNLTMQQKL